MLDSKQVDGFLRFNEKIALDMHEICQPLVEKFNLSLFCHSRINADMTLTGTTTRVEVVDYWLKKAFPVGVVLPAGNYFGSQLTPFFPKEVQDTLRQLFNIDHSLFIVDPYQHHCDIYLLATTPDNASIINNYLSDVEFIKYFLLHYKDKTHKLLTRAQNHKMELPKPSTKRKFIQQFPFQQLSNQKLPNLNLKRFYIRNGLEEVYLTKQEFTCVTLLLQGLSMQEIADKSNISGRTVETHFKNIRNKLSCRQTIEAIYKIIKLGVIDFVENL